MSALALFATDAAPVAPAVMVVNNLQRMNSNILQDVISDFKNAYTNLWNRTDVTPQDVFDEFDTNAAGMLTALQARLDFVSALAVLNGLTLNDYLPEGDRTPPAYTANEDGTVTVTT